MCIRDRESDCPIPLKYLDVHRVTTTDLESQTERDIEDCWMETNAERDLSAPWLGRTSFLLLRPPPKKGHEYVKGRLTRKQKTSRPGNVYTEVWSSLSPGDQKKARALWPALRKTLEAARKKRGIYTVQDEQIDDYQHTIAEARQKLKLPPVPAMPLIDAKAMALLAKLSTVNESDTRVSHIPTHRPHQARLSPAGCCSDHNSP